MIIISIITLILSTIIQGIMSNYLGYTYLDLSMFSTLYILVTLLVLNPYFENKKKYLIILIIFGLIMDIVYANTFILNTCLFLIAYYISRSFHFFFPYNWLTMSISNLLCVFAYHIISFLFLSILNYDSYTFLTLLKILSHSILMTIIYTNIIYAFLVLLKQKFQLREVK